MPLPAGTQGSDPRGGKGPAWALGSPHDSGDAVDEPRPRRPWRHWSSSTKGSRKWVRCHLHQGDDSSKRHRPQLGRRLPGLEGGAPRDLAPPDSQGASGQ
eukprot:9226457-Alexandrium_andersonii.AAC.1